MLQVAANFLIVALQKRLRYSPSIWVDIALAIARAIALHIGKDQCNNVLIYSGVPGPSHLALVLLVGGPKHFLAIAIIHAHPTG